MLYVPALHAAQVVEPDRALYEPARQLVHTADELAVDTAAYAPAVHATHAAAPGTVAYVPAAQLVQPVVPVVSMLYVPAAQLVQAEALERLLYVPAPQATQADAPTSALNALTRHVVQPLVPVVKEL